jgi:hypothetical protein
VEELAGEPIASFEVAVEDQLPGHYGYGAEKLVPTITYSTVSNKRGTAKLFVKWSDEPGPREAHHYEHLARHQAPVPRLYGALVSSDRREMIFLELLQPVHDLHPFDRVMKRRSQFPAFLRTAARFNAVQPSAEYAARLRNVASPDLSEWHEKVNGTLDGIWQYASTGDLGQHMRELCASAVAKRPALLKRARRLVEPLSDMPTGLTHNDFYPDSVGKREATGELLLVDLESVGVGPRFADVARWIGPPDDIRPRCFPRRHLAQCYLEEYAQCGGNCPPLSRFLEETRLLWVWQTFDMLWFRLHRSLDGRVDWTEDRDEGRRVYQADLYRELKALLAQAHGGSRD